MTLTAPHVRGDSVRERTDRICAAWDYSRARLARYWRGRGAKRSAHFYRSLEWTPGDDGAGHPHVHCWLFCPFLDRSDIEAWWSLSLQDAGLPAAAVKNGVIVDIREVRNPDKAADELIKYLLKDIDAKGSMISPGNWAAVYEAFDGRRQTQASIGFISLAEPSKLCKCEIPDWYTRVGLAGCFEARAQ